MSWKCLKTFKNKLFYIIKFLINPCFIKNTPNDLKFEFYESIRHGKWCSIPRIVKNSLAKAQSHWVKWTKKSAILLEVYYAQIERSKTLWQYTKIHPLLANSQPIQVNSKRIPTQNWRSTSGSPGIASQNSLLFKLANLGEVEEESVMRSDAHMA